MGQSCSKRESLVIPHSCEAYCWLSKKEEIKLNGFKSMAAAGGPSRKPSCHMLYVSLGLAGPSDSR